MGVIEVAGKQAQVIVANPAGITCNGCGFINASRATLTTGEPRINAVGNLENYRVTRGLVRIDGLGMDSSSVSYTDVIARAVQINAALWAQYLRITTGVNEVNAQNTQATPIDVSAVDASANPSFPQPPSFALDVAAIGGMYAQKIYLVGTEAGVGVRNAGLIGPYAGLGGGEIVFTFEAGKTVNNYVTAQRKALQDQLMQKSNDADQQKIVKDQLTDLNRQERVMNILIGAVAGLGSAAVAKETLSVAAEEMRKLMIVDSIKFAGVTDGKTILNNDSGSSAGLHGDGKKLGGTRIDLDLLCGADNKRCRQNEDGIPIRIWSVQKNITRFTHTLYQITQVD